MRPFAVFPLLCALAALVLSLLCLFAGSQKNFLQNADIVTVNTSRIGQGALFNTSDGDGGFFSNLGNEIQGEINNLTNDAAGDLAKAIGIHDFYKVHVMTYCEGFFKGNATEKNPGYNITFCSKRKALFSFDLDNTLSNELVEGANLADIHWPEEIRTKLNMLKTTIRAMFVLYCIAIAFEGLCVITSALGVLGGGRLSAFANWGLFSLAFLSIGIASALATAVGVKSANIINSEGDSIGLSASKGKLFIGLTWAATGVMAMGAMAWIFECVVGRRRRYVEKS